MSNPNISEKKHNTTGSRIDWLVFNANFCSISAISWRSQDI